MPFRDQASARAGARRARRALRGCALLGMACRAPEGAPDELPVRWAEGRLYHIGSEDLPAPSPAEPVANDPQVRSDLPAPTFALPPGFHIQRWAGELVGPRQARVAPNGDVIVSESFGLRVTLLRDTSGDGRPDFRATLLEVPSRPFGLELRGDWLYVGLEDQLLRVPYRMGEDAVAGAVQRIAEFSGGGHWTRDLLFSADGAKLYVSLGSRSNADLKGNEPPRRAVVLEMNPDGTGQRVFASGLRNPVGLRWHPQTGQLWTAVNERDGLGDDLPPDYVTSVRDGGFYGWPDAYIGPHPEPRLEHPRPDRVAAALPPDVLLQAHSAPLGLLFYTGAMFPDEYRGDLFVALHGSADRSRRTGYKVVRVHIEADGRPTGSYQDFATGWCTDPDSREVWGRPAGLAQLADGSLLVLDSGANAIWRVHYAPPGAPGSGGARPAAGARDG